MSDVSRVLEQPEFRTSGVRVIWQPLRVTRNVEPRPSLSERLSRAGIPRDTDSVTI